MKNMQVKDIMTSYVSSVHINSVVSEVVKLFDIHNIHHIPVVDDAKQLVGIVSSTDLDKLRTGASLFNNPKKSTYDETIFRTVWVREIMTDHVQVLTPSSTIYEAYQIFKENKFRALPIVDQKKLVGIVTPLDLLHYFFEQ